MADYDSSLPIRSEADGTDERLHVKIVDGTSPAVNQMTVDSDNNAHVELHGNNPAGTDVVMQLSEDGEPNTDGFYDASNNTLPASSALILGQRQASPDETHQTLRATAVGGASDSVCLDVALHDEDGAVYSEDNPLPVVFTESEGTEVQDYDTASAIAKDATSNHDYSVAENDVFLLTGVLASASGKMKIEIQIGDGGVSETFSTVAVAFNSTANPNINEWFMSRPVKVTGTANTTTIRIIRTNLDNQAQDVYSTIVGLTKP